MPVADFGWDAFLRKYNAEMLHSQNLAEALQYSEGNGLAHAVREKWLGHAGATEVEVAATEKRLDFSLPPSYRSFLLTSNGWWKPGTFIPRLWAAHELEWLRTTDRDLINDWSEADPQVGTHLQRALRISDQEVGGSALYLLIPAAGSWSGEGEAWFFASWVPGAVRYQSFWELMQHERESFREQESHEAKRLVPGGSLADFRAKLPNLTDELMKQAAVFRASQHSAGGGSLAGATASALEEVAEKVRELETRDLASDELLKSLIQLQQEISQRHSSAHSRQRKGGNLLDLLRLARAANDISRAEGFRQAAARIQWFVERAPDWHDGPSGSTE